MTLIVLSGPSAVGKDWLIKAAVERWAARTVIPLTTRPPRPDEVDGVEYDFISVAEFQSRILRGDFLVWDFLFGNYYGYDRTLATAQGSERDKLVVIHCLARMALRLKAVVPDVVLVYLASADFELLDKRLAQRSMSREEFDLRVRHREEEAIHSPMFDFVIEDAAEMDSVEVLKEIALRLPK